MGSADPRGKIDENLKSENVQKDQFSMFMLYFESNQGKADVDNGAMLTTYLFRYTSNCTIS